MFDFMEDVFRKLFPKSRPFIFGENFGNLIKGISKELTRINDYSDQIKQAILPSGNLPEFALEDWEETKGIERISEKNPQERNDEIQSKHIATGGHGADYLQDILQAAGYDLYVTENIPRVTTFVRIFTFRAGSGATAGSGVTAGSYSASIDPRGLEGELIPGPLSFTNQKGFTFRAGSGVTAGSGATAGAYSDTIRILDTVRIPDDPKQWGAILIIHGPGGVEDLLNVPLYRKTELRKKIIATMGAGRWAILQVNYI